MSLTSRVLQLAGSLCGTLAVVNHNRRDDALQDGCPAACRSTRSICNHGRPGYVEPRLSISEIGDFAGHAVIQRSELCSYSPVHARPACSHTHISGTQHGLSLSLASHPCSVYLQCPCRRGALASSFLLPTLPKALPMWLSCILTARLSSFLSPYSYPSTYAHSPTTTAP